MITWGPERAGVEKDHLAKRIGSRMKILRKQRGLTLHETARQACLSPSLISRIENGLTMPSIQTLQFIADGLSTDIGYFFRQEVGNHYVVSRQGKRRVLPADLQSSGALGDRRPLYDTEPLAEGMENPFMVPMILRVSR